MFSTRDPLAPLVDLGWPSQARATKIHAWCQWITHGKTFHYSVNWFHSGNAFTVEKSDILFLSLPLCCYYYRALGSEATTETTPLIQLFWCLDFLCVGCRRRSRCNQLSFFSSGDPVYVCTSFFCLKKMQSAREVNHVLFSFVFSSIILSTTSLTIWRKKAHLYLYLSSKQKIPPYSV